MNSPFASFAIAISLSVATHIIILAVFALSPSEQKIDETANLDIIALELSTAENEAEDSGSIEAAASSPAEQIPLPSETASMLNAPEIEMDGDLLNNDAAPPDELDVGTLPMPKPSYATAKKRKRRDPNPKVAEPVISVATMPTVGGESSKVDSPDTPAEMKTKLKPVYPQKSRIHGEQGVVHLQAEVSESGSVNTASIIKSSGYARLDDAAMKALLRAKFNPAKKDGNPITSTVKLSIDFQLVEK